MAKSATLFRKHSCFDVVAALPQCADPASLIGTTINTIAK